MLPVSKARLEGQSVGCCASSLPWDPGSSGLHLSLGDGAALSAVYPVCPDFSSFRDVDLVF